MKGLLPALTVFAATSCVPGSPSDVREAAKTAPIADAIRFGGCAPVRYRAIEPGEIRSDRRVSRSPPPPVSFKVRPSFTPKAAHKAIASKIALQLTSAKKSILKCIEDEIDDSRGKFLRLSVTVHAHGARISYLRGIKDQASLACAKKAMLAKIRARTGARTSSAFLNFNIQVGSRPKSEPTPPGPIRKRGTVEILSNEDRADEALALTAQVFESKPALSQCLAELKQAGTGTAVATLVVSDDEVSTAAVDTSSATSDIGDCWASALSGMKTPGVQGGTFHCALAFGAATPVPVRLQLAVDGAGLVGEGDARITIDPAEKPPSSDLYKRLLQLRFADRRPSPAPALLRLAPDVRGEHIVAIAVAARAADIEIVSIDISETTTGTSTRSISGTPTPQLGRFASRAATTIAIVDQGEVWLGLAREIESATIAIGEHSAIAEHIGRLAKVPGIFGRRDALIGIANDATAASLQPVVKALRAAGFDQLEITSAESARARLAR